MYDAPQPPSPSHARRLSKVIVALVAVGLVGYTVWKLLPYLPNRGVSTQTADPQESLIKARKALLQYSRQHAQRPGSLPCPDLNSDGLAELPTAGHCPSPLGRFPWKTLGFSQELRDRAGETLWYVISPSLRDDPIAQPIHISTATQLTLDGKGGLAALIIGPGRALPSQSTRPDGPRAAGNQVSDYLEAGNIDDDMNFVSQSAITKVNDEFVTLTQKDLMAAVAERATTELAAVLAPYQVQKGGYPPDQASFAQEASQKLPPGHWLLSNLWLPQIRYTRQDPAQVRLVFGECAAVYTLKFPGTATPTPGSC